eukprot:g2355.t1
MVERSKREKKRAEARKLASAVRSAVRNVSTTSKKSLGVSVARHRVKRKDRVRKKLHLEKKTTHLEKGTISSLLKTSVPVHANPIALQTLPASTTLSTVMKPLETTEPLANTQILLQQPPLKEERRIDVRQFIAPPRTRIRTEPLIEMQPKHIDVTKSNYDSLMDDRNEPLHAPLSPMAEVGGRSRPLQPNAFQKLTHGGNRANNNTFASTSQLPTWDSFNTSNGSNVRIGASMRQTKVSSGSYSFSLSDGGLSDHYQTKYANRSEHDHRIPLPYDSTALTVNAQRQEHQQTPMPAVTEKMRRKRSSRERIPVTDDDGPDLEGKPKNTDNKITERKSSSKKKKNKTKLTKTKKKKKEKKKKKKKKKKKMLSPSSSSSDDDLPENIWSGIYPLIKNEENDTTFDQEMQFWQTRQRNLALLDLRAGALPGTNLVEEKTNDHTNTVDRQPSMPRSVLVPGNPSQSIPENEENESENKGSVEQKQALQPIHVLDFEKEEPLVFSFVEELNQKNTNLLGQLRDKDNKIHELREQLIDALSIKELEKEGDDKIRATTTTTTAAESKANIADEAGSVAQKEKANDNVETSRNNGETNNSPPSKDSGEEKKNQEKSEGTGNDKMGHRMDELEESMVSDWLENLLSALNLESKMYDLQCDVVQQEMASAAGVSAGFLDLPSLQNASVNLTRNKAWLEVLNMLGLELEKGSSSLSSISSQDVASTASSKATRASSLSTFSPTKAARRYIERIEGTEVIFSSNAEVPRVVCVCQKFVLTLLRMFEKRSKRACMLREEYAKQLSRAFSQANAAKASTANFYERKMENLAKTHQANIISVRSQVAREHEEKITEREKHIAEREEKIKLLEEEAENRKAHYEKFEDMCRAEAEFKVYRLKQQFDEERKVSDKKLADALKSSIEEQERLKKAFAKERREDREGFDAKVHEKEVAIRQAYEAKEVSLQARLSAALNRVKTLETDFQKEMTRCKQEKDKVVQRLREQNGAKMRAIQQNIKQLATSHQKRLGELKEAHNNEIELLKKEHLKETQRRENDSALLSERMRKDAKMAAEVEILALRSEIRNLKASLNSAHRDRFTRPQAVPFDPSQSLIHGLPQAVAPESLQSSSSSIKQQGVPSPIPTRHPPSSGTIAINNSPVKRRFGQLTSTLLEETRATLDVGPHPIDTAAPPSGPGLNASKNVAHDHVKSNVVSPSKSAVIEAIDTTIDVGKNIDRLSKLGTQIESLLTRGEADREKLDDNLLSIDVPEQHQVSEPGKNDSVTADVDLSTSPIPRNIPSKVSNRILSPSRRSPGRQRQYDPSRSMINESQSLESQYNRILTANREREARQRRAREENKTKGITKAAEEEKNQIVQTDDKGKKDGRTSNLPLTRLQSVWKEAKSKLDAPESSEEESSSTKATTTTGSYVFTKALDSYLNS